MAGMEVAGGAVKDAFWDGIDVDVDICKDGENVGDIVAGGLDGFSLIQENAIKLIKAAKTPIAMINLRILSTPKINTLV